MKTFYILRGLPGSGKSTIAKELHVQLGAYIISADNFHVSPLTEKYNWRMENIKFAHDWCRLAVRFCLFHEIPNVVVDNTNISKKEFQPYLDMAEQYGYQIEYVQPKTEWAWDVDKCFVHNKHNVPKDVIQRMKDRFETV